MELVLIRHAQPAWADDTGAARNDPGLTALGRDQADHLAGFLPGRITAPAEVLVSPAQRTRETAEPVLESLGLARVITPWLLEIGAPNRWEGVPEDVVVAEIARNRTRPRDQWWDGVAGGETFRDFHARIVDGLDGLLATHGVAAHRFDPDHLWDVPTDAPCLVLVAHAGTNSVITSHLLGLTPQPWEWERFPCDHASLTILRTREVGGGAIWALEYFSDVGHLPAGKITA